MKSILVPTNFSPASYNAAYYAVALANQLKITQIIFLNTYMQIISDQPETANFIVSDIDDLKKISEEGLQIFSQNIQKENTNNIELKTVSDYNILKESILNTCENYNAELIVMPIAEVADKFDEFLIGSNAVEVARDSKIPVIIVPDKVKFNFLKRILLACDLRKVKETTPTNSIKQILDVTNAEFFVLHVEANADDFKENITAETLVLDDLLGNYNPKYNFAADKNFTEAIDKFAIENSINLIITIPKKHGFFEGIFKRSQTKDLAFHTHIPLMAIHE